LQYKCISEGLMHVAAWYRQTRIAEPSDQSSRNLGNKCRLARSITVPNFVALRHKCTRDPLSKICASGKVDQSSPKSLEIRYAPMPLTVPISSRSTRRCTRKASQIIKTVLHPSVISILSLPRHSLGQSSPISALMYSKAWTTNVSNFVPFWQPVYTRYLLLNFVDLVESVTDRRDRQKNSKGYVSAYHAVTIRKQSRNEGRRTFSTGAKKAERPTIIKTRMPVTLCSLQSKCSLITAAV